MKKLLLIRRPYNLVFLKSFTNLGKKWLINYSEKGCLYHYVIMYKNKNYPIIFLLTIFENIKDKIKWVVEIKSLAKININNTYLDKT